VHEPCSQRNALANADQIYRVLEKIPGLDILPLPGNGMCCGAGGTKMVTQPELASAPRDEKVEALLETGADMLISTNLTCALHLASGIRKAGHEIEVLHPVRLLARLLE
jgi:glycolate oxidase iron-sulfur subunit